jgi:splicing factor 3B subunit 1
VTSIVFFSFFKGLFHPARRVRDVYWKVYNTLYIGAQDTLVAGYPRIVNDSTCSIADEIASIGKPSAKPRNDYARYELDYIL